MEDLKDEKFTYQWEIISHGASIGSFGDRGFGGRYWADYGRNGEKQEFVL